MMTTPKLDTRQRQEQIAKATLELVAAGGLKNLSVAAVARRVGLVPSALYRHFKGKNEVLDASLDLIQHKLLENVKAVCEETDDALEQLHTLLMRHVGIIRENRGILQVIFSQDIYIDHPGRRRGVYQNISDYLAQVAKIIRAGQDAGQIDAAVDPGAASVMFLGMIQPSAILWHMSQGEFDVTKQAQRAWPLFVKAIQNGAVSPTTTAEKGRKGKLK